MTTLAQRGVFTPFEILTDALKAREQNRVAREEIAAKERIQAAANRADLAKAKIAAQVSMQSVAADREKATAQDRLRQRLSELQTTPTDTALTPFEQQQQQIQNDFASMYQRNRQAGMDPIDAMAGLKFGPTGFSVTGETEPSMLDLAEHQRKVQAQMNRQAIAEQTQALDRQKLEEKMKDLEFKRDPTLKGLVAESETEARGVAKTKVEKANAAVENANTYKNLLPKLTETYELLDRGNLTTGAFQEFRTELNKFRDYVTTGLGIQPEYNPDGTLKSGAWVKELDDKLQNTQELDTLMGSEVFPQVKALGIGARGLDTKEERIFLRQVLTGDLNLDPETLKAMVARRMETAYQGIKEYNKDIQDPDSLVGSMAKKYPTVYGSTINPKTHFSDFGDEQHAAYIEQVLKLKRPKSPNKNIGPIGPPLKVF